VTSCLLRLILILMAPVWASAAPLQAVPAGDYRPLRAAQAEPLQEGFEAAWLAALGEQLGNEIALVETAVHPDLRIGAVAAGTVYFSSEIAALAAAEAGPGQWADLDGEPFCVTAGSPHAAVVASRFGGIARVYPSAAHALIGLKLGECRAVVDDRLLLEQIAVLPEWRRYNRLLTLPDEAVSPLRVDASDAALQQRIEHVIASKHGQQALADITQHWIDEVAFRAYVLADTLDCH